MFGINQTLTQDSNVLTIFQTTYLGVDLVIIVSYTNQHKEYQPALPKSLELSRILLERLGKKLERKTNDKILKEISMTIDDMANTVFLNGMMLKLELP